MQAALTKFWIQIQHLDLLQVKGLGIIILDYFLKNEIKIVQSKNEKYFPYI
jgi:hypothetical protein